MENIPKTKLLNQTIYTLQIIISNTKKNFETSFQTLKKNTEPNIAVGFAQAISALYIYFLLENCKNDEIGG